MSDAVGTSASSSAEASAPTATLSALIALQSDPGFRDGRGNGKTLAAAQQILERLDRLQQGLLSNAAPADTLETLQQAAALRAHAGADPALLAIFDEITLRARVELAKLGQ